MPGYSQSLSNTPPSRIFVPVIAVGNSVHDNGNDVICVCFTPEMAKRVAELLNQDACVKPAVLK